MKLLKTLLLIICLFVCSKTFAAHQLYADIDGVSLPYGTKFELSMAQDLTTQQAIEGDLFEAYLTKDIYINNKLILPSKTLFRGRIEKIKYSRALSRPASLYLAFDHLVTKKGVQLPLNSGLASNFEYVLKSDGGLTTNGNYFSSVARDFKKAAQIVPRSIKWGATSGDDLFKGAKFIFVPTAALGGSIAFIGSSFYSIFADLIRHGDEIIIPKGAVFEIILLDTLDIPS